MFCLQLLPPGRDASIVFTLGIEEIGNLDFESQRGAFLEVRAALRGCRALGRDGILLRSMLSHGRQRRGMRIYGAVVLGPLACQMFDMICDGVACF